MKPLHLLCRTLLCRTAAAALFAGLLTLPSLPAAAQTLKASHQWPSGTGDFRDEMIQIIARELERSPIRLNSLNAGRGSGTRLGCRA